MTISDWTIPRPDLFSRYDGHGPDWLIQISRRFCVGVTLTSFTFYITHTCTVMNCIFFHSHIKFQRTPTQWADETRNDSQHSFLTIITWLTPPTHFLLLHGPRCYLLRLESDLQHCVGVAQLLAYTLTHMFKRLMKSKD